MAFDARKLNEQLKKADEAAKLFNSREALFGVPATDYSKLRKTMENFEPFFYLWTSADDWRRLSKLWYFGPFNNLNPDEIEKAVGGWWKGLFKFGRLFTQKGYEPGASNCEIIRKEVQSGISKSKIYPTVSR